MLCVSLGGITMMCNFIHHIFFLSFSPTSSHSRACFFSHSPLPLFAFLFGYYIWIYINLYKFCHSHRLIAPNLLSDGRFFFVAVVCFDFFAEIFFFFVVNVSLCVTFTLRIRVWRCFYKILPFIFIYLHQFEAIDVDFDFRPCETCLEKPISEYEAESLALSIHATALQPHHIRLIKFWYGTFFAYQ